MNRLLITLILFSIPFFLECGDRQSNGVTAVAVTIVSPQMQPAQLQQQAAAPPQLVLDNFLPNQDHGTTPPQQSQDRAAALPRVASVGATPMVECPTSPPRRGNALAGTSSLANLSGLVTSASFRDMSGMERQDSQMFNGSITG